MKQRVLIVLLFIGSGQILSSVSLDEILRPLLRKRQWAFELTNRNYTWEYFSIDSDFGERRFYSPDTMVSSGISLGLGRGWQLDLRSSFDLPWTHFNPNFHTYTTAQTGAVSGRIRFRPSGNLQVDAAIESGLFEEKSEYVRNRDNMIRSIWQKDWRQYSIGGTWLSGPASPPAPPRIGLDLDSSPLLDKNQWRLSLQAIASRYESRLDWTELETPQMIRETHKARNLRLTAGAGWGLQPHWQLSAEWIGYIPFQTHTEFESYLIFDESDSRNRGSETDKYRDVFSGRLNLTWRPSPQFELYSEARRHVSESDHTRMLQWALLLGGSFLTRGGSALVLQPDLNGIHRPLLEQKQWRGDWVFFSRTIKDWDLHQIWLFQLRSSWGLFDTLQMSLYWGMQFFPGYFQKDTLIQEHLLGFELYSRHGNKLELFFSANIRPADEWIHLFPPFPFHRGFGGYDYFNPQTLETPGIIFVNLGFRLVL